MQLLLLACCLVYGVHSAREADLVKDLPGVTWPLGFKQYAGFLKAAGTRKLFYWFVESENDPAKDPLVIWFNGGPGCSSLTGLFDELGPFRPDIHGKNLVPFEERWNKVANIVFLESPAGVGYSHSDDKNYTTNDDHTAFNNHEALKDFFVGFPEYKNHSFFLTGESYAGVYVPTLAALLVDDPQFNLKAFAVGNPVTDFRLMRKSVVYNLYSHGVFGRSLWDQLVKECCDNWNASNCNFYSNPNPTCMQVASKVRNMVWRLGLNPYNINALCAGGVPETKWVKKETDAHIDVTMPPLSLLEEGEFEKYQQWLTSLSRIKQVRASIPCMNSTAKETYLNRPDVRRALHVPEHVHKWETCSSAVMRVYKRQYVTVDKCFLKVLSKNIPILLFSGDLDLACDALASSWFIHDLGVKEVEGHRPWHYIDKDDKTTQIAGFVRRLENLQFVTVKGAGHFVPTDKPQVALEMFIKFLKNEQF